nr:helix-turn-helix domain-containing protein [Petropleomorpha daqingensis]
MVLERAAAAVATALDRTRRRAAVADDPAAVEVLLETAVPLSDRLATARRLGLTGEVSAVAVHGGGARVAPVGGEVGGVRAGIGPAVPVGELPASWAAARTALRFTAEGTEADPGPRVVRAEELGGLLLLADAVRPGGDVPPDVRALSAAAAGSPGLLATLDAVATTASLRTAAAALHVHHSTLQERVAAAERALGWDVREPQGRLRLQLALVVRRLLVA